ncbi:MAG: hypothetical protein AB1743_08500 [Actinomycetota bacterium]
MARISHLNIHWIGTYMPTTGLSINSYLILDEYPTLINTGAPVTVKNLIKNIQSIMDLHNLRYIVLNQSGIAYAGGLEAILSVSPQARVVTSEHESLNLGLYGLFIQPLIIQQGDKLEIGRNTLQFFSASFIGSPSAIFVYHQPGGILFSGEAFSITVSEWKPVLEEDVVDLIEAYYDTHIGDSMIARDSIAKLRDLNINLIAPGHGPMLKNFVGKYVNTLSRTRQAQEYYDA